MRKSTKSQSGASWHPTGMGDDTPLDRLLSGLAERAGVFREKPAGLIAGTLLEALVQVDSGHLPAEVPERLLLRVGIDSPGLALVVADTTSLPQLVRGIFISLLSRAPTLVLTKPRSPSVVPLVRTLNKLDANLGEALVVRPWDGRRTTLDAALDAASLVVVVGSNDLVKQPPATPTVLLDGEAAPVPLGDEAIKLVPVSPPDEAEERREVPLALQRALSRLGRLPLLRRLVRFPAPPSTMPWPMLQSLQGRWRKEK